MLTDTALRLAKPGEKPRKLTDGNGLYLLLQPTGSKLWRFDFRFSGKRKSLALGVYPDVPLKEARLRLAAAREQLAAGIDPSAAKQEAKRAAKIASDNTFEAVARAWWQTWRKGKTDGTADNAIRLLELHVFAHIGTMPVTSIKPADVLLLLRRIEATGTTETLKRARARIGEIYIHAIATGMADHNPAEGLHKALPVHREQHRPALRAADMHEFFVRLDAVRISNMIKTAIRLQVLTFVRPGELRCALWNEFDLEKATWTIPAERDRSRGLTGMKMREEHIVPLSRQAVEILRELKATSGGHDLLFPNRNGQGRPISDGTVNQALRAMGYEAGQVTGAGFRATATGALLELGYRPDVIDKQLAHRERNQVFAAYSHHAQFMAERRTMMQGWADYLDRLRRGADVIPFAQPRNA